MKPVRTIAALALSLACGFATPALAGDFAVLAGTAVTCTDATVTGDVGVYPGTAVTQTHCTVAGTVHAGDGVARVAYQAFLAEYARVEALQCDTVLTTLNGQVLPPGVYCIEAYAASTGSVLTLDGPANGTWIFKIGTSGTGYLEATNFSVVMTGGGEPCNVTWWVAQYATLTDSDFVGTILAGAAITITGGDFDGNAFAKAAVTMTGTDVIGCEGGGNGRGNSGHGCNQGVGNGPEGCDPGNSNQGDPNRSNDEKGGTPGKPGRKGGNGK